MKRQTIHLLTVVAISVLAQLTFAAPPRYEIIDLGTLGGDSSEAWAINNNGQIVGWAERADATRHAVLFDFNHPANNIDLGTLAGNWSEALSINIHGCTVGTSHTSQGIYHAALFDPSGPSANIDLGGLGGDFSNAYSINDHSQIVGSSRLYTWDWRATLFDPTGAGNNIDLGAGLSNPAGSDASCALSINNNGQIVGYAHTGTTSIHNRAILFDPSGSGNSIDLTPGKDDGGEAHCINDVGQIVGWSWKTDGAALFNPTGNGHNIPLGSLPGAEYSYPYSINNRAQIVGAVKFFDEVNDVSFGRAVLFDSTGSGNNKNLNHLIDRDSGWVLEVAKDINNNGWIVGYGINPVGETHAYLLIPKPVIIYVDADAAGANDGSSWADAFNYLQDALTAAWSGDEIRVAQGIYTPDSNSVNPNGSEDRTATFQLKNGVTIKGSYAGYGEPDPNARDVELYETILTGDLNGNDVDVNDPADLLDEPTRAENSYHIVTGSGTDQTAVLDGFTITAGNANGSGSNDDGGGMYNSIGNPTVLNCTFSGNRAYDDGGGVYCRNGSSPMITNCTIAHNSAQYGGGIKFVSNSNATISNCTISGNLAEWGGGINCFTSTPTIINCAIKGNSGAGIYCSGSIKSPTIINSTVTGNGGAGIHCHGACATISSCAINANMGSGIYCTGRDNSTLVNCSVLANSGENGGGIHCGYSEIFTIRNCVVTGNSATASGGGIYCSDLADLVISNCIIWDNTASHGSQMALMGGRDNAYFSAVWTTYSDIEGGESEIYVEIGCTLDWGPGNIDADPCFVDPGYWDSNGVWIEGDYHLLPDSPCIDAGDPNYIAEPNETDLDGRPRVIGGRIDMGAYEAPIFAEARILSRTINLASKGNWITCHISLPEDYNVVEIDPNSVLLEGEIKPEEFSVDQQKQVAVLRFSREEVQSILNVGEVELTITGRLTDGTVFEGTDTIKVIDKARKK